MTILHCDFISRTGPPSFLFDGLLGSDLLDVAQDVDVLKNLLVIVFKAHKFNARAASGYAEDFIGTLLRVAPNGDAFRVTLSMSIDIGNEIVLESVKAQPTPFLLTLPSAIS